MTTSEILSYLHKYISGVGEDPGIYIPNELGAQPLSRSAVDLHLYFLFQQSRLPREKRKISEIQESWKKIKPYLQFSGACSEFGLLSLEELESHLNEFLYPH